MYMVFRRLLVCLLWLWLPVSQAADSGWLRAADNQHASVRLRAQTESNGDTRLLLDVALEKGWKTYWRSPGEGGIAPAIAWHTPLEVNWRWPTPQRFDVAGISTQGYHGDVSFPMTLRGKIPPTLSGVLTLSTCSNVCILTDYPFSLDMTTPAGERFNYDFTRAMGTLPLRDGLTSQLTASYVSGKLTVTARRDAGWQQPALFIDSMEDVDFGKPSFTSRGDTLTTTVPVTDSWGEAAPDLSGKTLSLVLADSGQAQESHIAIAGRQRRAGAGVRLGAADGAGRRANPQRHAVRAAGAGDETRLAGANRTSRTRRGAAAVPRLGVRDRRLVPGAGADDDRATPGESGARLGHPVPEPVVYRRDGAGDGAVQRQFIGAVRNPPLLQRQHFPRHPRRQRLNGPFLAGRLRHPAGDALYRAVPRYRPCRWRWWRPCRCCGAFSSPWGSA
ncbi:membrane protein, suppressor for copper-sensitivity ScsB [Klebsiella pneumoniae]|uniref:Membrane protein, suppressor for copper-sensitivity ScsB n=1 Tax=Klebsiella pneumoniae TaxID=573 RepID=A0A4P0YFW7_KLEPN|nr:membrane protein, suppressor for copper-sensitivity ScsB [Klebsiella pneumoniae]